VTAGYSGRSLADKLGIKPGMRLAAVGAPPSYAALLGPLPADATLTRRVGRDAPFVHCFVERRRELEREFPRLEAALARDGALWVSWPKRAAGAETDLTEDIVRAVGLAHGLVDVKVCAVDERWSGLKFVRRRADRKH
jgi:hypothetical protein